MSNVDKLIKELCPNGVEFAKLSDISTVLRGKRLTKSELSDEGTYPVFHGGIEPIGYYSECNRKAETVMVINVGASAGTVGYSNVEFWSSDGCFCISESESFIPKFLYYALCCKEHEIQSKVRKAGIPTLDNSVLEQIIIPLPPIQVQEEIVNILDRFVKLEAELEAELEARKKQYEFYRGKMFDEGLEEEAKSIKALLVRTKGTKITAEQMKKLDKINAPIKIFAGGKTVAYFDYADIPEKDIQTKPSVVVKSRGVIEFEYCDQPFSHKSEFWAYHSTNLNINIKYVYYYLRNKESYFQNIGKAMGSLPQISLSIVDDYKIPIPPLKEQERIVAILDRFDMLINDITEGLPAEIKMRKQQYEYYRDKLLSFEELKI